MGKEFDDFERLWYNAISPSLWCERYAHPLHRVCPVILNYENLPGPFKKIAEEMEHEGKTGDKVQAKPQTCIACDHFIRNGGVCDPI